jgi:hypothetical protein
MYPVGNFLRLICVMGFLPKTAQLGNTGVRSIVRNIDGTITVINFRTRTTRTYKNVGYMLLDARLAKRYNRDKYDDMPYFRHSRFGFNADLFNSGIVR